MKDTTAFVAGCATTGAIVLMMLVVRSGMGETIRNPQSSQESAPVDMQTVPLPPPPAITNEATADLEENFSRELDKYRSITERLENQLQQQKDLTADLQTQLDKQQNDTAVVMEQLQEYRASIQQLTDQQARLVESMPQSNDTQKALVWGMIGLFLLLLVGGGAIMTVIAIWLLQSQRHSRGRTTVMYPVPQPPAPYHPYPYFEHELLPPPVRTRQVAHYDIQDYAD